MMVLSRRAVLVALMAVSAHPFAARADMTADPLPDGLPSGLADGLDAAAVTALAASYHKAIGAPAGPRADMAVGEALFPQGAADMAAIRAAVADDFRQGRMFVHAGWRLSHTEGRLFALLARML